MQKGAVNHNTSTPWSFQAHSKKQHYYSTRKKSCYVSQSFICFCVLLQKLQKNSSDIFADLHKRAQFINDIREFVFSETLS